MAFESRLLSLDEQWYAREHPFDVRVVRVKKLTKEVEDLEAQSDKAYKALQTAIEEMNAHRGVSSNG